MEESNQTLLSADSYENLSYYYYYGDPILLEEHAQDRFHRLFPTVCYGLIFCVSLAGNGFLMWILMKQEDLRRTSSQLLLHLTVSDLLFTLPLPLWAAYLNGSLVMSEAVCVLLNGTYSLGLYSYMTFLTAMTVHRYWAVIHAVSASTFRPNVYLLSGGLWVFCLAFAVAEMVFSETVVNDDDSAECIQTYGSYMPEYLVYYMQILVFFLLPFTIITFCYGRMWFRIQRCRMAQKRQAVKLILLIVVGFFICWAPYNIFLLIYSLSLHGLIHEVDQHNAAAMFAYTVSHTLAYFHCCLSPVVHIFGAGKFRGRLRHQLSGFRRFSVRERTRTLSVHTGETPLSVSGQH
ncbi:chemokine XC receptor 1 [Engraulis encrasicolus]|uniref:chemokine XC receptor 1 n=1 Tax=Engraulis encrasicolus TaxID=184585 RepID=UPI002FCFD193